VWGNDSVFKPARSRPHQSQLRDFRDDPGNEYLCVHNLPKTFLARRRLAPRHNRRWRHQLQSADDVFRNRFSNSEKFRKTRQIFHNPNPDTTLRPHECYSFPARRYASTSAVASGARLDKKFPLATK
jgi:hypothetical protein